MVLKPLSKEIAFPLPNARLLFRSPVFVIRYSFPEIIYPLPIIRQTIKPSSHSAIAED
jgi:hypothetical protein